MTLTFLFVLAYGLCFLLVFFFFAEPFYVVLFYATVPSIDAPGGMGYPGQMRQD